MIEIEGEIKNKYDLHIAAANFFESLIGRELEEDEFQELLRIIKGMARISRNATDEELDEFSD